ncbi:uncharacterized protein LOC121590064 isoform X1 [Anopheles merus]|uniref:uncharacterized protein LOC121590064 isoform X1 n=1 Tax=Anopheles merus TaxID=30066 RepID=UPI001BE43A11|nr:uncharacterized protein LOC121590064 isoform X1 [Anopheles merus]
MYDLPYEMINNRKGGLNLHFRGYVYRWKTNFSQTTNWQQKHHHHHLQHRTIKRCCSGKVFGWRSYHTVWWQTRVVIGCTCLATPTGKRPAFGPQPIGCVSAMSYSTPPTDAVWHGWYSAWKTVL